MAPDGIHEARSTTSAHERLRELTESYLKSLIAESIGTATREIDSRAAFGELGVNSFQVLKIIKRLETDFGRLPKSLLFENFNVDDLAGYFVARHGDTLEAKFARGSKGADATGAGAAAPGAPRTTAAPHGAARPDDAPRAAAPILVSEREAYEHPELKDLVRSLFARHKIEGCVSRGTRKIAPNLFIGSARRGFFNYGRSKDILLLYGYTGEREYLPAILAEVLHYCTSRDLQLNIFSDAEVPPIGDTSFSATPFGVLQRIVGLGAFTLQGGPMRRLRYQVAAFQKCGPCRTEEYLCGSDRPTAERIAGIIDRWCESRTVVNPLVRDVRDEILAGALTSEHRVFLTYLGDALQNVILIAPMCAEQNGYLMDLEFYPPEMPLGGLEFAIVEIIKVLVAEGCDVLSLGGTYGCKLEPSPSADPEIDKILDDLRQQNVFNDAGNLQFKNKFRPESRSIYLCRPVGSGQPENVIDIIMMIAEPDKAQVAVEEHGPVATGPATAEAGPAAGERTVIEGSRTSRLLARFGFDPLNVPADQVEIDLKTDSWAQLELPAIDAQMRELHEQLPVPVSVDAAVRAVFPFAHFVLTASGQAAERALFRAWPKPGIVVQNLLFPSTIFHSIDNGFTNEELPHPAVFAPDSTEPCKGNLSWEDLRAQVARQARAIAFACVDVCNNAAGGQAVSLGHLREVKALLAEHQIPLVIDATRILENAQLLIEREAQCAGRSLRDVVRDLLSCADVVIGSLTKDFCVRTGGIVAANDRALLERVRDCVGRDGAGIDLVDQKLIALSLQNRKAIEARALRRMEAVRRIWQALDEVHVPLVRPAGGHCVLIDVARLAEFRGLAEPVASFLAWLYLNTGMRGAAHGVGMQSRAPVDALVRLAVPVGLKREQVDQVIERLVRALRERANIPDLALVGKTAGPSGEVHRTYRLLAYRNVAGRLAHVSEADLAASEPHATLASSPAIEASAPRAAATPSPAAVESWDGKARRRDEDEPRATGPRSRRASDVAIVGMAGRYPKSNSVHDLWKNLVQGRDCIEDLPDDRHQRRLRYGAAERYRGGWVDDVDRFDSLFFNISPREAEMLDPQERLFLEVAWEALEDAGYYPETLAGPDGARDVGVFVGAVWAMYQMLSVEERQAGITITPNSFLWSIANRVSYWMNFSGPSLTLDTACSSSLTALYLACESLQAGECSAAIVGGVNLDLHQAKLDINLAGGALSSDGVCRSFGKGANGYVAGEGVGALLLKPLDRALADGDNVHGVVRSVVANHGGRTSGYTVPNPKAQASLILGALRKAEVDARSISYIEAHGTGTALGDPIEIAGLSDAFNSHGAPRQSCAVGSVKSNMGHLEAAAGIVGVTKVLLQMRHRRLAPSLHSAELNEFIDFENSPFYVVQRAEDWATREVDGVRVPLRAGVSSFGAGGANAHVILERYEAVPVVAEDPAQAPELIFPLSARSEEQLRETARRLLAWVEGNQISLKDVAHTLQIGRKSFDHRLAVVAATRDELLERLRGALAGARSDVVAAGHVKAGDAATRLLDRGEKQEFVRLLARRRDPRRLAELWVEGLLADWHDVQDAAGGRRVSLPTYPFADQRHWAGARSAPAPRTLQPVAGLHPLIDSNESTFERQLFKKTFRQSDFFIHDHHVGGIPTLPGVAYLEWARKAGELAAGRRVRKLRNVVWMSPLVVQGATATEAFIELVVSDGAVRFEVFGGGEQGDKTVHCQGLIEYAPAREAAADEESIDLEAVRARCVQVNEGRNVYPVFKSFGLDLGPSFQVLQEVYKNDQETLGNLKLPACREAEFDSLALHPSLMDGSLQAGVGAQLGAKVDEMFVPFFIGEVELLHPLRPTCFSYVTQSKAQSARVVKSDVRIVDETGRVLVKLRESTGVPLRELHKKPTEGTDADGFATLAYGHDWERAPLAADAAAREGAGCVVLFAASESLRDRWRERQPMSDKGALVWVRPGTCYEESGPHSYGVAVDDPEDFSRLFESLVKGGLAVDTVCFAWPVDARDDADEAALARSIERDVYGFLFVCQALIRHKLEGKVQLLHLHATRPGQPQLHNEAVDGFIKTLRLEHPRLLCKSLEVRQDAVDHGQMLDVVMPELRARVQDATAVRCEGGERFVRRLKAVAFDEAAAASASGGVLRRQGVYLITGGGAGLGLMFAEFLAREYDARLVLAGRSPLSERSAARLEALERQGAQVAYVRADVCRREGALTLVRECQTRFGGINGILHCAGVLRDSALRNKTREEMDAVLAPKVFGALHLDELTQAENLDVFVMFSSLTALGGNAGQCDYGFANRFMDALAEQREALRARGARRGRTLSVNWGLWAEGGMKAGAEVERFLKEHLGMKPIGTSAGLQAFVRALDLPRAQVAILEGAREKLESAWGLRPAPAPAPPAARPAAVTDGIASRADEATRAPAKDAARGAAYERIQRTIVAKLSSVLQMEASSIPDDAPFADFGVNSVMGVEMVRTINEALQIDLDPLKLFEYTTVNELAEHIWATYQQPGPAPASEAAAAPVAPRPAQVEAERGADPPVSRKGRLADVPEAEEGRRASTPRDRGIEPLAVIGMSGRFADSESLDEFWEHLQAGRDLVKKVTRWEPAHSAMSTATENGYCAHGSFVESIDRFDPSFFGISALEAVWMDPQQRLFLEEAWRALEHAGYAGTGVHEKRCGVYVGCGSSNYERLFTEVPPAEVFWGNAESVIPARIAYYLNLQGPAIAVDTASSSSLVAVHLACQGLWAEETDMALAGGVFLQATPGFFQVTNRAGLLSPDGKCYTFDARANGFVPGEGVGVVVLKRLREALRDGDHIHGVIAGSGINQNGKSNGLIAPNARAQERLYRSVYERFQIDPESIQLVEANGTGTLLGDSIEYQALNRAFRQSTHKTGFCALGSVATNLGHAATAAGVAGLLKVLLALGHRQVPPSLHFEKANPSIDFGSGPFYVNTDLREWDAGAGQARRGAVTSFGIGGTNAHVVVEEAPAPARVAVDAPGYLFVLSARGAEQLRQQARNLLAFARRAAAFPLNDVSHTLFVGRMHLAHRLACVARTRDELIEALACWLDAGFARHVHVSEAADGKASERASLTRFGNHCIQECRHGSTDAATYVEHLTTLADLYVQGCPLDFLQLFPAGSGRVSLPTYPFADERYWIATGSGARAQGGACAAERDGVERQSDTVSA